VAEVQALDDHRAGGKHSAAEVVAKAQAVLSESCATADIEGHSTAAKFGQP
jgi:hypothetical protein